MTANLVFTSSLLSHIDPNCNEFECIFYRYNHPDTITILSSESTLDELFAIDEAVGGRIGERSKGYAINLSGKEKNYRRKLLGIAV